jgi:hypothetical protein
MKVKVCGVIDERIELEEFKFKSVRNKHERVVKPPVEFGEIFYGIGVSQVENLFIAQQHSAVVN